jgi:predicted N-acetyltransferase YhbS
MFPDAARRPAQLAWLEGYLARTRAPTTLREHIDRRAIAVWVPPGVSAVPSLWAELRSGLLATPFALGLPAARRALIGNTCANERLERSTWPAWYLDTLAVDPAAQGQGLGAELMRHGLARAGDAPVVLFTVKESNVRFYQRFGFQVTEASPLVPSGPPAWTMRRG